VDNIHTVMFLYAPVNHVENILYCVDLSGENLAREKTALNIFNAPVIPLIVYCIHMLYLQLALFLIFKNDTQ
jgi:hypothetical protein